MHAMEDDMASVCSASYVQTNIGANHVRKVLLHDSSHVITLDNEKETVARETAAFFGAQGLPGSVAGAAYAMARMRCAVEGL
jgi:carboxylesterase